MVTLAKDFRPIPDAEEFTINEQGAVHDKDGKSVSHIMVGGTKKYRLNIDGGVRTYKADELVAELFPKKEEPKEEKKEEKKKSSPQSKKEKLEELIEKGDYKKSEKKDSSKKDEKSEQPKPEKPETPKVEKSETGIKIDTNIPVREAKKRGRKSKYPWANMKVGDSFFVDNKTYSQARGICGTGITYFKNHEINNTIQMDEEKGGYRFWLIEREKK